MYVFRNVDILVDRRQSQYYINDCLNANIKSLKKNTINN